MLDTIVQLRKEFQARAVKEPMFANKVLQFLILAEAALVYSPAAALLKKRQLFECACGKAVSKLTFPFRDTVYLDYGKATTIVTSDGTVVTGGLENVIVRNEVGNHIGLPKHECNK